VQFVQPFSAVVIPSAISSREESALFRLKQTPSTDKIRTGIRTYFFGRDSGGTIPATR
jgi:hypothetical protein